MTNFAVLSKLGFACAIGVAGASLNALMPTPSFAQAGSYAANPQSVWGKSEIVIERGSPKYYSESGNHYLVFQPDGNLVVYSKDNAYVWGLDQVTQNFSQARFIDFIDGNLNVRDQHANILWKAIPGQPNPQATLRLGSDGALQMYACRSQGNTGGVSWSSNGNTRGVVAPCGASGVQAQAGSPIRQAPAAAPAATAIRRPPAAEPAATTMRQAPALAQAAIPAPAPVAPVVPAAPPAPAPPAATSIVSASNPSVAIPPLATQPDSGPATGFPIRPGQSIVTGKKYVSPDGQDYMQFAEDGNLVIKKVAGDRFLWGLNAQKVDYQKSKQVMLLADGRLVAGDVKGDMLWSPVGSDAANNSFLTMENAVLKVVSPSGQVTWSSDEPPAGRPAQSGKLPLPPYDNGKCTPDPGFSKCRVIDSPRIFIHGTGRVSDSAMDVVKKVYADLTSRLKPAYPASSLNWVKVAITNGESSADLTKIPGIGNNGRRAAENDDLRGGGGENLVWITEQMICKTGVKTRGAKDVTARTFDQVIHEFGHTMDFRFDRRKKTEQIYKNQPIQPAEEGFPWAIQGWFGAPSNVDILKLAPILADMEAMFASRTTYSCSDYRP